MNRGEHQIRNPEPWLDRPLRGVMDIHVHVAPDTRPRWCMAAELADRAAAAGLTGLVLKHHDRPTVNDARAARERQPILRACAG